MNPEEAFASAAGKECGQNGCDLPAVHTGKCRPPKPQPLLQFTEAVRCGSLTVEHLGREFKFQEGLWSLISVHFEQEWQELRGDEQVINEVSVSLVRVEMFLVDVEDKAKEFIDIDQMRRSYGSDDRYVSWTFVPGAYLDFYTEPTRPHTPQQVRQMERECNNAE